MGRLTLIVAIFLVMCVVANEAKMNKRIRGIKARKLSAKNIISKGDFVDKAVENSAKAMAKSITKDATAGKKPVIKIFVGFFKKLCLMVGICKREKPEPEPEPEETTTATIGTGTTATPVTETSSTAGTATTVTEGTETTTVAASSTTTVG